MVAKKKTGKKIATKKTSGKGLTLWKDELKKYAKQEEATITVNEGSYISIQGGEFSFRGNVLPEPLKVVILDHCFENQYYTGGYDPDNPQLPACFAINKDASEMAPGEAAPDKQSETCSECWANAFASADTGRGKACKNGVRLLVIPGDNLNPEKLEVEEELAILKVPPTSLKYFNGYVRKLIKGLEMPSFGAITSLSLEKLNPKDTYKVIKFEFEEVIPDDCIEPIIKLRESNQDTLLKEYTEEQYKQQQTTSKPAGKKKTGRGKPVTKKTAKKKPGGKSAPSRF
jgi:hypothetical protein